MAHWGEATAIRDIYYQSPYSVIANAPRRVLIVRATRQPADHF